MYTLLSIFWTEIHIEIAMHCILSLFDLTVFEVRNGARVRRRSAFAAHLRTDGRKSDPNSICVYIFGILAAFFRRLPPLFGGARGTL